MSDYIKREDAMDAWYRNERYTDIEGIPNADVVEQTHGKWIEVVRYGLSSQRAICECSKCGSNAWVYDDMNRRFKYCPNCGARMDDAPILSACPDGDETKDAKREYYRAWRAANRDKTKEYQRRYWEKKAKERMRDGDS